MTEVGRLIRFNGGFGEYDRACLSGEGRMKAPAIGSRVISEKRRRWQVEWI